MGTADVVPGVSGGTVALVLGIYHRLVTSLSRFDVQLGRELISGRFASAASRIDLTFLATLGVGIAIGFVATVKTLSHLLEGDQSRPFVLASFLGMMIGAVWIVFKMVRRSESQKTLNLILGLLGALIALLISRMSPGSSGELPPLWYLFVCGAFGICAMILPGISGAAILILLGVYQYLIGVAKQLVSFKDSVGSDQFLENLVAAVCFALGCITGLLVFSRVLKRLLDVRPGQTLSLLCGLMIGSLPVLWPFQENTTPLVEEFKSRVYRPIWPETWDTHTLLCLSTVLIALAVVIGIEWLAQRLDRSGQPI